MAYDEVSVLDTNKTAEKRKFLEMVRIYQEENGLNEKSDVDGLSLVFTHLINVDHEIRYLSFFNGIEQTDS